MEMYQHGLSMHAVRVNTATMVGASAKVILGLPGCWETIGTYCLREGSL